MPSAASAGWRYTIPNPGGGGLQAQIYSQVAICAGYDFDTQANAIACVRARARVSAPTYFYEGLIYLLGSSSYIIDSKSACVRFQNISSGWYVSLSAVPGEPLINSSGIFLPVSVNYAANGRPPVTQQAYSDPSCSVTSFPASGATAQKVLNLSLTQNSNPGHNNPEGEPYVCKMPPQWAVNLKKPPAVTDGHLLVTKGATAQFKFNTGLDIPVAHNKDDLITPGNVFTQKFPQFGERAVCFWLKTKQIRDEHFALSVVDAYLLDPDQMNGVGPGLEDPRVMAGRAALKARLDVSKPAIPYGAVPAADGKITKEVDLCTYIDQGREMIRTTGSCLDELGKQIKLMVEAEWPESMPTAFTHPAPAELARDNPDCTQKFMPSCAWHPTRAVTPETKKEELVRLTRDGQTIVRNDPAIYPDTRYPPVMVNAGTAPAPPPVGSEPGDPGNPSQPQEGDGEAGGDALEAYLKCAADLDNCVGNPSAEDLFDNAGIREGIEKGMGSSSGVADSLMSKAMAKGRCTTSNTSEGYCSALGVLGALTGRSVDRSRDLVLSEGDIVLMNGRVEHVRVAIPASVMNLLALLFSIGTYWAAFKITLRGHT